MNIAIIGGGWVGCHLTKSLNKNHNVDLYESHEIFSGSSFNNQNRLHIGYHYPRNFSTRNLCKCTFKKFLNQYGNLINDIPKNLYAVPYHDSLTDYGTYMKIFDDFDTHREFSFSFLQNVEGCISTDEKYIDPIKSKKYFQDILKKNIIYEKVTLNKIEKLKTHYDLVINCTNNLLDPIEDNVYSEVCHTLVYKKIKSTPFDSLTLVDGKLFSIYLYDLNNNLFSLTDVEFTPNKNLSIDEKRKKMEEKVLKYYPEFLSHYSYDSYYQSNKFKYYGKSDSRVPVISKSGNYIKTFTGKIQGIYDIENYLNLS